MNNIFKKIVNEYDMNNIDILFKYNHSLRVQKLIVKYSILLNYTEEEIYLANAIGLLHDIGRFEQLRVFNSFDDRLLEHADYAVKILFEDNLIQKFNIEEKYYEIIKKAIRNHNKLKIEDIEDTTTLKLVNLIRDVDKLDIIRTAVSRYVNKDYDLNINNKVLEDFYAHKSILKSDIKNNLDQIVLVSSFVFDINNNIMLEDFKEAYKEYFKVINNEKFENIENEVHKYIEKRTKC